SFNYFLLVLFTLPNSRTIQVHSFVLTNIDSKWRFGFCRHDPKSPTAMVIITYLPWHDTFMRFLNVLADIRKNRPNEFASFLSESYNKGVPEPGACLKLHYDRASQTFLFQRPQQFQLPSIPENHNLNQYYNFVEPKFMIGIFAAMLAERRIIFVSRRLDILSSCVQAANAFLYPMVWQHIFIPVLPMQMKDILAAPMPFLIGVPEAVYETLRREEIGDVVILNCDKRTLETPFDDVKSMPQELVSSLKKQLSNQADHRGDRVSKIFLGILVQLIGGYRDAVKFNDKITFDPETFIESRPAHLRQFLDKMLDLQIFQQFIEERLDMLNTGQGFSDEFEVEYFRYAEKSGRKTKQYKDLLKNFKDKVKEGGKGVKTAYKGLRSKFRETTPPKSKLDSSSSLHLHHQYDVGGHHQSAPNSPVFNKRPQTIALPDDVYHTHNPHHMLTPSSTSLHNSPHILLGSNHHHHLLHQSLPQSNGGVGSAGNSSSAGYHSASAAMTRSGSSVAGSTSHMNNNHSYVNSNNNHMTSSSASDIRSPTLSPTSSNSSSEMNLWQEMQHHLTLFKSPAVNRNLKPTNGAEGGNTGSRPSSRAGAPISPPGGSSNALPRIQESVAIGSQPLLSLDLEDPGGSPSRSSCCNNNGSGDYHDEEQANFDLSPDAPCPPIPPRRFQSAADALAAIQISPPPMSPPSSSSSNSSPYRTYNNFIPPAPKPKPPMVAPTSASSPSIIDQSPPLPSPPPPPPLKAQVDSSVRRNDILQFDDEEEQLITLTTTTATVGGHGAGTATTITTTTSMSMTFGQPAVRKPELSPSSNSALHRNHFLPPLLHQAQHQQQQQGVQQTVAGKTPPLQHAYTLPHPPKSQAPQPPQRPPLAPKPTFRKESQNGDVPDFPASTSGTGSITTPPAVNDESLDLITLDTTNSSFELEDFDPLNERARPIGGAAAATSHAQPSSSSAVLTPTSSYASGLANVVAAPGVTMPTASFPSTSLSVNNPIYPYFTPLYQQNVTTPHSAHHHPSQHQLHRALGTLAPGGSEGQSQRPISNASSNGVSAGAGARESNVSDDFELLRNYGLDKFSLLDGGSTTTKKQTPSQLHVNGSTGKGENQNTTNLSINAQVLNGRQVGCNGGSKVANNGQTKATYNNWTTFD
uniref:UDENN domain-containing protein n=1 Tax=Anopheles christyi TaxID=43041 RepID=A0A182K6W3_9DIPT